MKQHTERYLLPVKTISVLAVILSVIVFMSFSFKNETTISSVKSDTINKDSIESVKAFMDVYKVLMSPRCMNCHPSGDVPLQGDDSHIHNMLPQRGKDGKGIYAMKCMNCHQPTNLEGLNKPPGNPNWHLPPSNMKMVFEGRTPGQLARQIINPKTNGNKTIQQLIAHADDGLVKAGWDMAKDAPAPPLSHEEFKKAWITWIKSGAYAPKQ